MAPHAENPVETTANGLKLDPVDSTANVRTLGLVEITVADQADLHNAQDQVDNTANHRTLGPVEIIAVEAVLHSTQDRVDSKGNLNKLDPVVSIVAEAVLRNMRDRIARDAANTDQSAGNVLESFKYPIRKLASRRAFFCWRSYYLGTTRPSYGIKSHAPLKPTRI